MIDAELKFGAFVPRVPDQYRREAGVSKASLERGSWPREDGGGGDRPPKRSAASDAAAAAAVAECAIGSEWTSLHLMRVVPYNRDTSVFTFALPPREGGGVFTGGLGLPVTGHLLVRAPGREHGGGDAVRPYTSVSRRYDGTFDVIMKRYDEWGVPESRQRETNRVFLYSRTDHSYKPPGAVSTYVHSLGPGDCLDFKFVTPTCLGRISFPFPKDVTSITMIAVGAGVAPMVRILQHILEGGQDDDGNGEGKVGKIRLLYGVRTAEDILLRERLDGWHDGHSPRFRVMYCVGSRWANVHFAAKTRDAKGPPPPGRYDDLPPDRRCIGWVDGDKVEKFGSSGPDDPGHRVFVCGLPGVYLSLCGPRSSARVEKGSQLHRLGFRDEQVIKF